MKYLILLCAWLIPLAIVYAKVIVPNQMEYCGMKLVFSQEARLQIQKYVDKIMENDIYFYKMVEKATLKFPIIEDAFQYMGLPEDIKYICIQESGLRGDAVSPSFAVGYWQFKDFTAEEVGLTINHLVDERKHLYRSSVGAAKYFYRQYVKYKNWVYAVTAYYTGTTGALPYVKSEYIGATSMYVTADVHWYALKAIAHKIAYQNYIEKSPLPVKRLVPFATNGETLLEVIAQKHGISVAELKFHNPWMINHKLPNKPYSYYVLVEGTYSLNDPYQTIFSKPLPIKSQPYLPTIHEKYVAASHPTFSDSIPTYQTEYDSAYYAKKQKEIQEIYQKLTVKSDYLMLSIQTDALYGIEFFVVGEESLSEISKRFKVSEKKLIKYNQLKDNVLRKNQILYLVAPRKAKVHILQKGEKLEEVAEFHQIKLKKILDNNDLDMENLDLAENQKIYLRIRKPRIENTVIYKLPYEDWNQWVTHEVKQGETLNSIAKMYQMKPEEIKNINFLPSFQVKPGQILKIKQNK
jgi:membrane-bound lytic murein transglycosylase D